MLHQFWREKECPDIYENDEYVDLPALIDYLQKHPDRQFDLNKIHLNPITAWLSEKFEQEVCMSTHMSYSGVDINNGEYTPGYINAFLDEIIKRLFVKTGKSMQSSNFLTTGKEILDSLSDEEKQNPWTV